MAKKDRWVIGVSGGPDSMALVNMMMAKGIECIVCHVNYQMRSSSDAEAELVATYCRTHGLEYRLALFSDSQTGNFQDRARRFRYDFFKDVALSMNAEGVIVGHHLDDDLETYVFQQERNMKSIYVGLAEFSNYRGLRIWRPLLDWTKDELIQYCHDHGIVYAVDQSNFETKYARNAIRHNMRNKPAILIEMKAKRREVMALHQVISEAHFGWKDTVSSTIYGAIAGSLRPFVLRSWLVNQGVDVFHMSEKFFIELDRQIMSGKAFYDFGELSLYCDHDMIALSDDLGYRYEGIDRYDERFFSNKGEFRKGISFLVDDFPLVVRSWLPGDKIELAFGHKSVSRYFVDYKIPRYLRKKWLVIENAQGTIIYVMGMGCDVHHFSNIPETFVLELNVS